MHINPELSYCSYHEIELLILYMKNDFQLHVCILPIQVHVQYMNLFVKTIFDKLFLSLTEIQGAVLWTKLKDLPMTIWVDNITDLWCL